MKSLLRCFVSVFLAAAFFLLPAASAASAAALSSVPPGGAAGTEAGERVRAADFRAVWVSTVLNLDYPAAPTRDSAALRAQALEILDNAQKLGFNAVILQVRPSGDALYPSQYFPWSYYLTGKAGQAPTEGFDPLAFWVKEAHARGMELHAWLNPYRVTRNSAEYRVTELAALPAGHPARTHPEWVLSYGGDFYFDPGIPAVRDLIVAAAAEIAEQYDVDGIHLDDYFYPAAQVDDSASFAAYAKDGQSLEDWRRENVNTLIRELDTTLHRAKPDIRFGVSPFGIWRNAKNDPAGSNTNGGESYAQHYADTRKWVKEGWLDYIAPQIYWEIGHAAADYAALTDWWAAVVEGTGVELYIGHAAYRVGASGQSAVWADPGELRRQLIYNLQYSVIGGSIFFRYGTIMENKAVQTALVDAYRELAVYRTDLPYTPGAYALGIYRPEADARTTLSAYYIGGSSDTGLALYVNGRLLHPRSPDGFWGLLVPLELGENLIQARQGDKTVERRITRTEAKEALKVAASPAVGEVWPTADAYYSPGDTITLRCLAPVGAAVKASFGGHVYRLQPKLRQSPDPTQLVLTEYSADILLPAQDDASLRSLGHPVYTMVLGSRVHTMVSDGALLLYSTLSGLYAKVKSNVAYAYPGAATQGGPAGELYAGMTDVLAQTWGGFARLGVGLWLPVSALSIGPAAYDGVGGVREAAYTVDADGTNRLTLRLSKGAAAAVYDNETRTLRLTVSPAMDGPDWTLPAGALFSQAERSQSGSTLVYALRLRDGAALGGFWTESDDGVLTLICRPKKPAETGALPLAGHRILLDPGHGGDESGALGLLGAAMPEKDINSQNALLLRDALEKLGATVRLTRSRDVTMSLEARVALSRAEKPDLYLSLHANSLEYDRDLSQVRGFSVYYSTPLAADAAKAVYSHCKEHLPLPDTGLHNTNLYVCRGGWAPAVLFEAAFMPNPEDFSWLLNETAQKELAETLADAVLAYFRG